MVGSGVDGAHAVSAGGQSTSDGRAEDAIDCFRVEALEERKLLSIKNSGVRQPVDFLNHNVTVSDDLAVIVDLLRGAEVVGCRVDERAGLHVLDGQLDGKVLVRRDGVEVLRRLERGRRHFRLSSNDAHDDGVAAAIRSLQTVGDGLVDGSAEVDEVVLASQGGDLAGFVVSTGLTVLVNVGADLRLVERERRLAAISISRFEEAERRSKDGSAESESEEDGGLEHREVASKGWRERDAK